VSHKSSDLEREFMYRPSKNLRSSGSINSVKNGDKRFSGSRHQSTEWSKEKKELLDETASFDSD
jgi:hypothetical protein